MGDGRKLSGKGGAVEARACDLKKRVEPSPEAGCYTRDV